jgi:hypothetical protein
MAEATAPSTPEDWRACAGRYHTLSTEAPTAAATRAYGEIAQHCELIARRLERLAKAEARKRILRTVLS